MQKGLNKALRVCKSLLSECYQGFRKDSEKVKKGCLFASGFSGFMVARVLGCWGFEY